MKYICEQCKIPCRLDAGEKIRSVPENCPWLNVTTEGAKWKIVKTIKPCGCATHCPICE